MRLKVKRLALARLKKVSILASAVVSQHNLGINAKNLARIQKQVDPDEERNPTATTTTRHILLDIERYIILPTYLVQDI